MMNDTKLMSLKEQLREEMKEAMKAKAADKLSVLRMLSTAIKNEEIKLMKELDDEGVLGMIKREVKQRQDAISEYQKGGREDLATKEAAEMTMLKSYLPPEMSDEEVNKIIENVITTTGMTSETDFGKLIKEVLKLTQGRADGQTVSQLIKNHLK